MPRKRKTAVVQRAQVADPDGTEGQNLEKEERVQKLKMLIKDFEDEVESRINHLRNTSEQMVQKLEAAYNVELCRIPRDYREMKIKDFLAAGGSFDVIAMNDAMKMAEGFAQSITQSSASKSKEGNNTQLTTIAEDENQALSTKAKKGRKKAKPNMGPPPTTGRTSRTTRMTPQFVTPVHGAGPSSSAWGATPLVTPKFDPRLPCTPAVTRDPKPGERLMSLAGSPITNSKHAQAQEPECRVPLRNKTLQLTASTDLNEVVKDSSDLDAVQLSQLLALQKKISTFIKIKKQTTR